LSVVWCVDVPREGVPAGRGVGSRAAAAAEWQAVVWLSHVSGKFYDAAPSSCRSAEAMRVQDLCAV
jgi:hypothetical protein